MAFEVTENLIEAGRQILVSADASAALGIIGDTFLTEGPATVGLTMLGSGVHGLIAMAKVARDRRNDPQVAPLLDHMKEEILSDRSSNKNDVERASYLVEQTKLVLAIAQKINAPEKVLERLQKELEVNERRFQDATSANR